MNLRVTILKDKTRIDGSHTIRIALSHNGATRYFVTRFSVPSEKNLRNGNVVNVSNATYINQQLRTFQNKIYSICDLIEDIDVYTCPQVLFLHLAFCNARGNNHSQELHSQRVVR